MPNVLGLGTGLKQLSLTEHTLNELREAILRIDHEPGSALRLDALQKQYGTSSSPLREALNRLVSEGLVTQDSNRGFRVATISLDEFRDMTEMRLLLEPEALRRSIEYGDDEWEGRVIAAHHRLRRAEEGKTSISPTLDEDWSTVHRAFHLELFSGGPSLRLQKQCASLFTEAERYRRVTARLRQRPRDKGAEHAAIMAAALDRDSGLAVTLLRNHIQSTADNMADALPSSQNPPSGSRLRKAV